MGGAVTYCPPDDLIFCIYSLFQRLMKSAKILSLVFSEMKKNIKWLLVCVWLLSCSKPKHALVLQTDFGLKDGAVNEMKGVAVGVDPDIKIYDLTHEIPSYNIWEAGYRLYQAAPFWPKGTVFVSVVDPGVGTARKSIVMKSSTGQFFVTPDNGTITLVSDAL